ncbi:hypothetical protein HER10_EVM0005857 [Colletotrichum scovillei]|uniref:Endonuclease iii-like protein n=1 Tax=Colletotrichum scovillei TaxID=1209932 RepID=A0A9P7QUB0_9PEZI|nr:uncharacterized protein HER10_EVM0005857 [Colletotrichum scovillei]KAF4775029.1 hypothetical protein HER10_EVM0005857 [Colletotrichum scovillei]KAG7039492.1 endonuclease iii-like protein [Colletotrichum scovillei]KAG7041670.1 endonuclease iii-like protein [Colletotrichum scovillei]KAG7061698.1 endonuclease iii-like protein [Colletotrichum scovillei]
MTPPKDSTSSNSDNEAADTGAKRKASEASQPEYTQDDEPDTKKPRPDNPNGTVDWLLSDEAFSLAFPSLPQGHGEIDWDEGQHRKDPPPESAGKKSSTSKASKKNGNDENDDDEGDGKEPRLTYPDSALTPFQNLVAALLLSKPISHRLGLRTINTLLNPPFGLRTPRDLDEAGFEGRRKVMWEARTQHKEKTAVQLGDLVEGVRKICGGADGDGEGDGEGEESEGDVEKMTALREMVKGMEAKEAQKKVEKVLTDGIKGVGPTGAGIFLRRVQEEWEEVFPYADKRALEAAVEFGIIEEGDGGKELANVVEGERGKFVRMLDVLVGIQLEKKMDEALKMARGDGE